MKSVEKRYKICKHYRLLRIVYLKESQLRILPGEVSADCLDSTHVL